MSLLLPLEPNALKLLSCRSHKSGRKFQQRRKPEKKGNNTQDGRMNSAARIKKSGPVVCSAAATYIILMSQMQIRCLRPSPRIPLWTAAVSSTFSTKALRGIRLQPKISWMIKWLFVLKLAPFCPTTSLIIYSAPHSLWGGSREG